MNLFVILLLAISLGGSAWVGFEPIDDWLERSMIVLATTAMVPAIALFQSGMVLQRFRGIDWRKRNEFECAFRRMTVAHALVWLTANASIILVLRWQDVVRGSWELGSWPALDELVILLPGILGIVASWLVFYELQASIIGQAIRDSKLNSVANEKQRKIAQSLKEWIAPRWNFVAIRFRVYFLAALMPLLLVVLSIDLHQLKAFESNSLIQQFAIVGALILAFAWPLITMIVWNTEPIRDSRLLQSLHESSQAQNPSTRIRLKFRRWETGGQIANAAVVGFFSKLRYVFLSDVVLDRFPLAEIVAIVRHESGHVKRNHVWWRLVFVILPVLVLSMHQAWLDASLVVPFEFSLGGPGWLIKVSPAWSLFLIALVVAAWWSNRWMAHQTEYEADLEAVITAVSFVPASDSNSIKSETVFESRVDHESLNAMRAALFRLAAYAGDDWQRATLFHPSISSRLGFLEQMESQESAGDHFRIRFSRIRNRLLLGWLVGAALGFLSWL